MTEELKKDFHELMGARDSKSLDDYDKYYTCSGNALGDGTMDS